jgi:hypothetical protein
VSPGERAIFNTVVLMVFGALLTFLATWFWTTRAARSREFAEKEKRLAAVEAQLALVGQTILPLSAAFQAVLVKQLTHFHTPEMDALLLKLESGALTAEDEIRLRTLLTERETVVDALIDDSERDAARMLPMVIKRVRADTALVGNAPSLSFVAVEIRPEANGGAVPKNAR